MTWRSRPLLLRPIAVLLSARASLTGRACGHVVPLALLLVYCSVQGRVDNETIHGVPTVNSGQDTTADHGPAIGSREASDRTGPPSLPAVPFANTQGDAETNAWREPPSRAVSNAGSYKPTGGPLAHAPPVGSPRSPPATPAR